MSSKKNINRRGFLGAGGFVAASALGAGAVGLGASPAHAELRGEPREIENNGRFLSYEFPTTSVETRFPGQPSAKATVLLPDGYHTSNKRYPVLYLLHGGLGDYGQFRNLGIEGLTAGKEIIVVMPDGGFAGWYSNPASTSITIGPQNWENRCSSSPMSSSPPPRSSDGFWNTWGTRSRCSPVSYRTRQPRRSVSGFPSTSRRNPTWWWPTAEVL